MELLTRLNNWLWPMCPTGNHRLKMGLVTNINGNQFCWHPDCMQANFADCKTHSHQFEPAFSYAGKLFERCSCGAHRIYGAHPDGTGSRAQAKVMRRLEIRAQALKTPNDRVEGRDAALSPGVPLDAVVGRQNGETE